MSKVAKPPINVLLAHPTNMWPRLGTKFEFIVLHYVGAVSTAKNNADYLYRDGNLGWSAHFFVDEHSIWQSVDFDHAAGHCGVDYSGGKAPYWNGHGTYSTNRRSIGIEMCVKKDKNGVWYFEPETVENTVKLVRWLMQELSIPINHVIRHYDVCWKTCPEPWVRNPSAWENFKKRLVEEEDDMISDKQMQELKTYITQTVNSAVAQKIYGDIKEVPDYWEGKIQQMLDLGVIDGGTPAEQNDHDVNLTRTEAKLGAIIVRLFDAVFPGKIDDAIMAKQQEKEGK